MPQWKSPTTGHRPMTTSFFLIAMVAAAAGQPLIACLVALAAVACAGRRKLN